MHFLRVLDLHASHRFGIEKHVGGSVHRKESGGELFDLRRTVLAQPRDECLLALPRKHLQQRTDRLE